MNPEELKKIIRDIPDYPKEGILFKDITTLLSDAEGLKSAIELMTEPFLGLEIDYIVGTEARGFIFAPAMAVTLGAGFIPARKPGKLPAETLRVEYDLEYGTDSLEIHKDSFPAGAKVLLVDDLLATGGTIVATKKLVEDAGGEVVGCSFLIELDFLKGREKLDETKVHSVLKY